MFSAVFAKKKRKLPGHYIVMYKRRNDRPPLLYKYAAVAYSKHCSRTNVHSRRNVSTKNMHYPNLHNRFANLPGKIRGIIPYQPAFRKFDVVVDPGVAVDGVGVAGEEGAALLPPGSGCPQCDARQVRGFNS